MRNKKRILFAVMAVCMMFNSIASCLGGNAITAQAEESTETSVTIRVEAEDLLTEISSTNHEEYNPTGGSGIKIGNDFNTSYTTWNVTVETAGLYTITTYGTGRLDGSYDVTNDLQGKLSIGDGAKEAVTISVPGKNNFVDYGETSTLGEYELSAGTHTVTLVLDAGLYSMDYMELTLVEERTIITKDALDYKEKGNTGTNKPGGIGYITSANGLQMGVDDINADSYATWEVEVPSAGTYTIKTWGAGKTAASEAGELTGTLSIGSETETEVKVSVPNSQNYETNGILSTLGDFELSAGTNTIKLALENGMYTIDYLVFTLNEATGDDGGSGDSGDSGEEETPAVTAITVEGESYVDESGDNSGAYTPGGSDRDGVKIGETISSASYAIWNVEIETAGTYTITTFGTGVLPSGAYSDANNDNSGVLEGTLSIGEGAGTAVSLTIHGYNDFATYGEISTLGEFELSAGTNTIKLAFAGGRYTMDYMVLTLNEVTGDDGGSEDSGNETPDLSNLLATIEAEDYTEGYSGDNWNQTGYYSDVNAGPIDITISYDDGETVRYRAIFTNGDWASYTVNIETEGAYLFVISGIGAGEFYLDDIDNPIPFECADDGNGIVANIMLSAGEHTIKIAVPKYLDMDYICLYEGGSDSMTTDDVATYVPPAEAEIDKDAVQLEIYVSPDGKDANSGTEKAPFATLTRAKEEVRKHNDNMTGNIIVHFAPGYYQLDETEVFSEEDSGTNGYSIIYKGDSETESSLISGGTKIEGWEATELLEGKIWKASTDIEDTRNLYVDGYPAQRARGSYRYMYTENLEPAEAKHQDNYNLAVQPADVKSSGIKVPVQDIFLELEHPEDVELVWPSQWVHQRTPVLDIYVDANDDGLVVFEMDMPYWEWANTKEAYYTNPVDWYDNDENGSVVNGEMTFYLENDLALLDEPGEFYFDKTTKTMYYYPYADETLETAEVYAGTTEFMIQVIGTSATGRVENITFDNLEFCYGAWTEPNTTGVQITQTDHIVSHRATSVATGGMTMPGQITLNFTRNVNIYNCDFRCLGSSALVMDNGVADSEVVGNVFMDISGTGIMIDSYEHRGILPEGRVRCDNILVSNNVIQRVANQYYGMTGISMYMPSNTTVSNNDISDVPYSGMIAGWGWGKAAAVASANNKIINNKIVNVMQVLTDGGHIYTLDRVHNLEIAGNYLVKSGDWRGGIYLDEGSRSFDIYDNVIEDSERWFFGRNGAQIEDIELYNNYYDAASKSDIASTVTVENNTAVESGTDGTTQWPQEALDIIEAAGLETEYEYLLEDTQLPSWRTDVIDTMPKEVIGAGIESSAEETATTIRVEGEEFTDSIFSTYKSEEYTPNVDGATPGIKIGTDRSSASWATWNVEVAVAGTYTITSLGTGYLVGGSTNEAGTLQGTMSIGGNSQTVSLTVHGYNDYNTYGEVSKLGEFELAEGVNTIKLALSGGRYTMDYMDLTLAKATVNGVSYGTLTEAIEAAEAGQTVALCSDVVLSDGLSIEANSNLVLDLNGNTLTAQYLDAIAGDVVDSSTDKSGLLKVTKGYLALSADNSQMPVWNGTDGYVFATMKLQEEDRSTEEKFSIAFRPSFGTMFNSALFADGMDDNVVKIRVRLTWKDSDGEQSQDFIYTEELIKKVYSEKKAFSFNAIGLEDYTDMTVTTMVISDSGVVCSGDSYTFSQETE